MGPFPYVRPALKKFRKPYIEELAKAAKESLSVTKKRTRGLLGGISGFGGG